MDSNTLSERISRILKEKNLKKTEFAHALGITPNYAYLLASGRVGKCSETLALLIEQKYGYPAKWILTGEDGSQNEIENIQNKMKDLNPDMLREISAYVDKLRGEDKE